MERYKYKIVKKTNEELNSKILTHRGPICSKKNSTYDQGFEPTTIEDALKELLRKEKDQFLGKKYVKIVNGKKIYLEYKEEDFEENSELANKFKKEILDYYNKHTIQGFQDMLNYYGEEGWEFVKWENNMVIFKKKIQ